MSNPILALQADFGVKLRDEYVEFLRFAGPGLESSALPIWPGVSDESDGVDRDDIEEESEDYWVADIASLWGVDDLRAAFEQAREADGHLAGWHLELLPHAYPIGVGYGGDFFVQVVQGKLAGNVFHLHHDEWPGDEVDELFELSTEKLLDALCANYAAEDMREFYATLCRLRGTAE